VLVVGGNCAITPGVVGGLQQVHGPTARIGLVWFDAHGDFNTPRTTLSGMLGGMPVAVTAGLAWPRWRELSLQPSPLPTDRIVMVDVRNLDAAEETLIRATDVVIAAPAPGFPGEDLQQAIADLAAKCDMIYLHIDSDILDERYVPNHGTKEPNGPDMEQVLTAIDTVMATGKVVVYALVSVWPDGEGGETAAESGIEMLRGGLASWQRHGFERVSAGG
jgi:arginase